MKVHHIGVITKNLKRSIQIYCRLGYVIRDKIFEDKRQWNCVVLMTANFSPYIELIEPINEMSSIYNFDEGYHHICYESEPGEDIIPKFKSMRIGKIFTKPIIAPALGNREVVFACLQNRTFVEFIL